MNAGAFAGALSVASIGRIRDRIGALLGGYLLTGLMLAAFGAVREPLWLGVSLFLLMVRLPAGGALLSSHLQSVVPAAVQGRVFALLHQINVGSAVLSFFALGPLVDRILQPAAESGLRFGIPGESAVSGISLLYVAVGCAMIAVTLSVMLLRRKMK